LIGGTTSTDPARVEAGCMKAGQVLSIVVVAGFAVSCGGSGGSPTNPSNPNNPGGPSGTCRNVASSFTYTTVAPGLFANTTARCTFDSGARTLTCTYAQTSNVSACSIDFRWRDTYNSVADFVNESKVVGRFLLTSRAQEPVTTPTSCSGPATPGSTTYTYDSSQRQLQSVAVNMTGASSNVTYVYSAWDAQNRPTAGTVAIAAGPAFPATVAYDDGARTITITAGAGQAGGSINILTLDADGNLLRHRIEIAGIGPISESAYTISARQTVCQ
jgi:hypothetical protein